MEIWISIDLMKGKIVRLIGGKPDKMIIYSNDPIQTALELQKKKINGLHVIDLDATLGLGNNLDVISQLVKQIDIPIQVGGGLRSMEKIKKIFEIGAKRVIIGTGLLTGRINAFELLSYGTDRIVVALDHLNGKIVINGWREKLQLDLATALNNLYTQGFRLFLSTNVSRDGTLSGFNDNVIKNLKRKYLESMYVAGGISSINDLTILKNLGIKGIILGRAFYEGLLNIDDILEVISNGCDKKNNSMS